MTHKNRNTVSTEFSCVWSAGCSLLRAKGFSCSLGVIYGGLGISKWQFLIKKIKLPAVNFFSILGHQTLDPDPESGSAIGKNDGSGSVSGSALNQCGSETLRRMLGSNPGLLRLRYWQPDAPTTRIDLVHRRLDRLVPPVYCTTQGGGTQHDSTLYIKELAVFPSPDGMSLIKLFLGGKNLVFSRPERVWSVTSRLGTGKWLTPFYSVVWPGWKLPDIPVEVDTADSKLVILNRE